MTESRQSDIYWPGFVELCRVPQAGMPSELREWVPLERVRKIYYGSIYGGDRPRWWVYLADERDAIEIAPPKAVP